VLHVFKALPVAREIFREDALPDWAVACPRDTIVLGWEERLRGRGRRRTAGGFEFATALPRGGTLRGGDCFALDKPPLVIVVSERPEPVFVIEAAGPAESAAFAYAIGNSHQPLMIAGRTLVCPDVPGMRQVLEYHGIPFVEAVRPFTPIGGLVDHRHQRYVGSQP
jgi:urease accessory protein UreE